MKNAKRSNDYNTRRWQKFRRERIAEHPYCARCNGTERLEAHHRIKPNGNELLFYDPTNIEILCKKCHWKETQKEIRGWANALLS
jgi:5-methylcytosine-specific restriction endonuclease McrA